MSTKGLHWLTIFDEDGEAFGEICDCEIGADHLPCGDLFPEPDAVTEGGGD